MRYLFLSLFLVACATDGGLPPSKYRRGTLTAPPPAPARPGVGAPVRGQPGYVGPVENLPRSPYTRVLPQTPETRKQPGIWASDKPDNNWQIPHSPMDVYGISLPYPSDAKDKSDTAYIYMCSKMIPETMRRGGRSVSINKDRRDECIVAAMFRSCAHYMAETFDKLNPDKKDKHENLREMARAFFRQKCTPDVYTDELQRYLAFPPKWDMRDSDK